MIIDRPPMGWNTWNTFGEKINEKLVMESADELVSSGLCKAGYNYLVIDDCWSEKVRNSDGRLVPSAEKFPHGMKYISDYVHSKGLKFGMYSCCGNLTCAGYPGSFGHEFTDASTFAEWGVDFLKYDYCYKPVSVPGKTLYMRMGNALSHCGRDIVFSACSWGIDSTEQWVRETGANMWRSTGDINDSWRSIKDIHEQQIKLQPYNSHGCFNDMDMLVVGMNGSGNVGLTGCSYEEYKTHFTLWSLLGSPLMIGCDIRNMNDETKNILMNRDLIEIDQDRAYSQPFNISTRPSVENFKDYVWARKLENGDFAIGMFNMEDTDANIRFSLFDLGIPSGKTLEFRELWSGESGVIQNESFFRTIKAHSCVMLRCKLVNC